MDAYRIGSERLTVTIRARGAEPVSLYHAAAGELLWQAGPAWPKHAPVLFPIVGELSSGRYRFEDRNYALGRHGFARERDFAWTTTSARACTLTLRDDAATREVYPFAFALALDYVVTADTLEIGYTLRNPGDVPLYASLGAHPAFRWPLATGLAKTDHSVRFAREEVAPVRRLQDALLAPAPVPTPVRGRVLALDPDLFRADALIFDALESTSLRYAAPAAQAAPALDIAWTGFRELGLWSKPGGNFLCIEPWAGYASPVGFDGDLRQKPGIFAVAPNAERRFMLRITVVPAPAAAGAGAR